MYSRRVTGANSIRAARAQLAFSAAWSMTARRLLRHNACGCIFFFSSRRRHTRFDCDWSSDVCSSDLARVTDLAHRAENLLDLVRRGGRPATDDLLQLLFGARDALEHAVELSVVEREDEIDVAEVVADLEGAAAHFGRGGETGGGIGARTTPVPAPAPVVDTAAAAGRLVQVTLRAEAPLKGGRALLVIKKAQAVGPVHAVTPPESAFEVDEFDGRFSFRIGGAAGVAEIERAVRAAGEVEHVTVGGEERRALPAPRAPPAAAETKSRHRRVDLGRLDGLMDLIREPVTARGRLHELAAYARDPP